MNRSVSQRAKKYVSVMAIVACLLLLNVSMARAAATFVTDLPTWESMVSDIEVFATDADNVFLAEARFGEAIEAAVAAAHEWLARDDG